MRLALGASRGEVLRLVLGQAVTAAAIGAVIGLGGSVLSSRLLASLLVQISPYDPIAIVGGTMTVLILAALAAYLPARRACRVDPLTSMRADT